MSLDPMANGRLNRWRHKGDGPATYTAGSKQFADDVIVLLDDIERLREALHEIAESEHYDEMHKDDCIVIAVGALAHEQREAGRIK